MPRDPTIRKVMIIGSGPIQIGQAAEFDFSGSQAALACAEEGLETVVVNSNPATIQTDLPMATRVYVEPLTVPVLERIIERERPDGILSGMGGQTALNLCSDLAEAGILAKYGVRLLGTPVEAIARSEDRELFRQTMIGIGEPVPRARVATTPEEAHDVQAWIGAWPVLVRPAYTLGGTGGGIAWDAAELDAICRRGLSYSRIHQVLIEESVLGWHEFEYEVMRDGADNCITICSMENIDPMGVHTGESVVVAPAQTLSDEDHQRLRSAAIKCIRALGVVGGCNIQFALHPRTRKHVAIEVNPRVSRSSALASKATGYPIARVAAKVGIGLRLDEIPNAVTGTTPASFEPALDYVVTKIPRWPFDKFPHVDRRVGTQMKSTGEVMSIGRTLEESLMKALRSLEVSGAAWRLELGTLGDDDLLQVLTEPQDRRLWALGEALRRGWSVEKLVETTSVHPWFLWKMKGLVEAEKDVPQALTDAGAMRRLKRLGFADRTIARLSGRTEDEVRAARRRMGVSRTYKMVDTCAAEFEARTPYYYSTFESTDEVVSTPGRSVVVVGSGPIRIGQGIEFDYSCVHAAQAIKQAGYDSVMMNNNPETVSTDFDTSTRLYFEPLTLEDVLAVIRRERAHGVMLQFGGQTSVNLALPLQRALSAEGLECRILGTSADGMDVAEDRKKFSALLDKLRIPYPKAGTAPGFDEAKAVAAHVGYPVLVRPSYVLGGRAMEVVFSDADIDEYRRREEGNVEVTADFPLLVDQFLSHATEVDVDAVSDGADVLIGGVMEHIEEAGVHSGDSTCFLPPQSLKPEVVETLRVYTRKITKALGVVGCINIQFAVKDDEVFVLEANPRASRTMPYVSKSVGIQLAKVAARVMLGEKLKAMGLPLDPVPPRVTVKAPVFPFLKLPGLDTILGPEMKSTGEVMGVAANAADAYLKAILATGSDLPRSGGVYLTVRDEDKPKLLPLARRLHELGFTLWGTRGTATYLQDFDVPCQIAWRISEKRSPDAIDLMRRGEIQLVINTPSVSRGARRDGFMMRRLAVELGIPFITNVEAARAAVTALKAGGRGALEVESLTEIHGAVPHGTGKHPAA